jgi:HAE1 family hydrophobic/amphiphilic exporter-1
MIDVTFPLGTPVAITEDAIEGMEKAAFELNAHFRDRLAGNSRLVTHSFALVGMIPRRDWKPGENGSHAGTLMIELISSEKRPHLSVNEVIAEWRARIGEIAGIDQMTFATLEGGPAGNPIEIQLMGNDFLPLEAAAAELKNEIAAHRGTFDIADDFKPGKLEKQFRIKEGASPLGVTMADIAKQLRQGFYGEEALRIQRGKDDLKVMVRYDEKSRRTLGGVEQMRIRTADGREVAVAEVAEVTHGRAYSVIHRVNRKRSITVFSDLDEDQANASQIVADIRANFLSGLMARYPGLSYDLEGQEKRTRESLDSLKRGFLLALMGIYLLLATQFRSYAQPIIIMIAIPFGLIGAIAGHLVMGLQLTMISLFGIVALSGIVVNDSLILIDFINRAVAGGTPLEAAVIASGKVRFRPVLLTSVTTVAGLFPLLLERSFQAQFLIPMAVSISFGLVAATLLTLLYVPALYLILNDIVGLLSVKKSRAESGQGAPRS